MKHNHALVNCSVKTRCYRRCSACDVKFSTKKEYLRDTSYVGLFHCAEHTGFDLELRTCVGCGSTLSTKIFRFRITRVSCGQIQGEL